MCKPICGFVVLLLLLVGGGQTLADTQSLTAHDLTVLDRPAANMMKDYLTARVDAQFARRAKLLSTLHTAADWDRRAQRVRRSIAAWTGPFPPRSPLRARVTGEIERPDFRMQKVVFESRPGFLVTANLYLPKRFSGPRPAVLNVIGHSPAGKATDKVQRRSIAQARLGFVALTIDAIGQGERQIAAYAGLGHPPGNAHQIIGLQAFLAGTHVFNFMAWDALRAVDYLVSRPEVDAKRIACTGCSGGGMMTTYILPFEPRIAVAVPACNPNTWSYRVHAGLGTDHEQVFFGAFAAGIDPRGDPLFCQVPKPLLIDATTQDNLNPPAGVRDLSRWLDKAYAAHAAADRFKTVMINGPHGYNLQQREAAYGWMLKWLDGGSSNPSEGDFSILPERDTWCTPNGNVYANRVSKQPHALVLEYLRRHRSDWPQVTNAKQLKTHQQHVRHALLSVLGLSEQGSIPHATVRPSRTIGDLRITPIVFDAEPGIQLPAVQIDTPAMAADAPVILYLHDRGKAALAQESVLQRLVHADGHRVLSVDLRGMGETAPGQEAKFWDFLSGKTIFAQRVADVRCVLRWLSRPTRPGRRVSIWARGVTALYAAAAAALEDSVSVLVLEQPLLSFTSVVTVPAPAYQHGVLVPGVLERLDLPQIYQACCPRRVTLIGPLRGDKVMASESEVSNAYRVVSQTYATSHAAGKWQVVTAPKKGQRTARILSALARTRGEIRNMK